ncbi:hypothetical protein KAI04_01750 [Candidatus Pacearchaeota archaeon]|nr:hypothetical protein [Candidatus Pacearchaeota archaeon]
MAELTINQLIKLILGILVVAAVVWGVYYVFKNNVAVFIENVGSGAGTTPALFLTLI